MHQRTGPHKQLNPETVSWMLGKHRWWTASFKKLQIGGAERENAKAYPKSRLSLSQSPRQRKQPWILWRPIFLPDFNPWRKNPMRMLGAKRRHVDFDLCRSWLYCGVFESLPSLCGLSSQLFKTRGNLTESKLKGMLKTWEWWCRSKPYMIYILQKQIVRGLTRTIFVQIQTQSA